MAKTEEDREEEKAPETKDSESEEKSDAPTPGRDENKPISDAQRKYLEPLAESQDAEVKDDMNEAEAAGTIDRLQENAVHVY